MASKSVAIETFEVVEHMILSFKDAIAAEVNAPTGYLLEDAMTRCAMDYHRQSLTVKQLKDACSVHWCREKLAIIHNLNNMLTPDNFFSHLSTEEYTQFFVQPNTEDRGGPYSKHADTNKRILYAKTLYHALTKRTHVHNIVS